MCNIKGVVYRLSHGCDFDLNRDLSTAYFTSSSGDSVDLLSRTICTTVVVSDFCTTNLAHGWWISIQSINGSGGGGNWSISGLLWWRSAVMLSAHCRHTRFRNLNSTVPVDVVRVKSYVNSLFNSTRVPVQLSVNKLNIVPERIMPGLIGVFRNC